MLSCPVKTQKYLSVGLCGLSNVSVTLVWH